MTQDNKIRLVQLLREYQQLGIAEQIDYDKFYLYSLITHSTAIEGSTVTELEAQLLFDEGITAKGKPMMEQLMNLLQMEFDVLPMKVLKGEKAEYIQALIDAREKEEMEILLNCMTELHIVHLKQDIDQYLSSVTPEMVDKWSIKPSLAEKLVDILSYMKDKDEIRTDDIVKAMQLTETTAKRYLRQLTEFGYLQAFGGNRNRYYKKRL